MTKNALQPLLALGALAMLIAATPSHAEAKAAGPKATFIKGDVDVAPQADPTHSARVKRGQEIAGGTIVKTGENARAELTFPDGSVVRVGPGAELKVGAVAFDGKTKEVHVEAQLVAGEAWAKVAKLVGKDAKFQMKTENAVAGVRGTIFRVNVDKDEATVVKVYNGAVAVAAPLLPDSASANVGPIDSNRKQIAAPFSEVNKKEFEHLLGQMMQVRITKAGVAAATPQAFTAEEDSKQEPEWVRWNQERDAGKSSEKSQ